MLTGISMNLIVTQRPNIVCWSNSCPFRLEDSCCALVVPMETIKIPGSSVLCGSALINNLLEFLGMAVNVIALDRPTTLQHFYMYQ